MTVHINSKDLQEILKTFHKLAKYSSVNSNIVPITFDFEPFRAIMMTDQVFVIAEPAASVEPPVHPYSFNPEILRELAFTDGEVSLYWDNESAPLVLKNNHLRTTLRVAVPLPEFEEIPDKMESIEVPVGLLYAVTKFLSIPFMFLSTKKELNPIQFRKNEEGFLEIMTEDGYSLARLKTNIPVKLKELDIQVPRYIIESLFAKGDIHDETLVKIGVYGLKSLFSNKTTQIYSPSMNTDISKFDLVLKDFKSKVSCEFVPKKLSDAIKPLISIIPKKDKSSNTGLIVKFELGKVSMSVEHKDTGDGYVDFVDGITDIYQENSSRISTVNMTPQAFQDYTNLLDVAQASMFANNRLVYYKGNFTSGENTTIDIEYIFPTVLG